MIPSFPPVPSKGAHRLLAFLHSPSYCCPLCHAPPAEKCHSSGTGDLASLQRAQEGSELCDTPSECGPSQKGVNFVPVERKILHGALHEGLLVSVQTVRGSLCSRCVVCLTTQSPSLDDIRGMLLQQQEKAVPALCSSPSWLQIPLFSFLACSHGSGAGLLLH